MKQIKVSDEVHEELTALRDSAGHTSIDSAVRELLNRVDDYKPWQSPTTLRELHHEEELSMREIGRRLDCSPQTVRKWLRRHDIEIRSNSHAPAGEDHPNHKDVPRRDYNDFGEAARAALERDGCECQRCGMTQEEHLERYGHRLHRHHVNEEDDRPGGPSADVEDLVTLCARCHRTAEAHSG